VLVEEVLLDVLAASLEGIELVVLNSVKDHHSKYHKYEGLGHPVELDDALRHLSVRDLLLEVEKLSRLPMCPVRGASGALKERVVLVTS